MTLDTTHLKRCIDTLEQSLIFLNQHPSDSIEYEVYRNATVKGYELTLETAGKLLKKILKTYFANPREVDQLVFKDVIRHAGLHGLLRQEEIIRWLQYRDNRNQTAHDYGVGFAEETLKLLPAFIDDLRLLEERLHRAS